MAQVTPKAKKGKKLKELLGSPEETEPTQEDSF